MGTSSLTFPAEAVNIRTARMVAGAIARACGLHQEEVEDVRLAVGEACAMVLAGSEEIQVTLRTSEDELEVAVVATRTGEPPAPDPLALMLLESLAGQSVTSKDTVTLRWRTP